MTTKVVQDSAKPVETILREKLLNVKLTPFLLILALALTLWFITPPEGLTLPS